VRFQDSAVVWLKLSLFWDVTRRRIVVTTFRDNLSVQSSRLKQPETLDP